MGQDKNLKKIQPQLGWVSFKKKSFRKKVTNYLAPKIKMQIKNGLFLTHYI